MAVVIVGLHALGFGILILVVAPRHFELGSAGAFAIGTGVTAYTLGLRHAFDADHISAIDNTTPPRLRRPQRTTELPGEQIPSSPAELTTASPAVTTGCQ
jgi:nickel/cobalt transporter (NiCoT) family protein